MATPQRDSQLTPEQVAELREAFSLFDEKDSGKIRIKGLVSAMKAFGVKPSDGDFKKMIEEIDQDGRGTVNFEEFRQAVQHRINDSVLDSEVMEAFQLFDLDGDDYLGPDDLKRAMQCMGERLTDEEAQAMMQLAAEGEGEGEYNGQGHGERWMGLAQFRRMMQNGARLGDDEDSR